ncbi:unnamed protein product [Ectocarpus sp. CCAP 1310/34]|nr:unnamed protein product [Ectocarpus sp. CCAP 1310/34]
MWDTLVCGISIAGILAYWGLRRAEAGPRLVPNTECHVGEGFVSVVVPAYNEGDGVKLTLATIDELAQDKSLVEIIVVDAGCKDHTMDAVASMKLDVKLSTTTSVGGRGPALNAGARMAKGDLLLFVHADTIVPPAFDVTLRKAFRDPEILMSTFLFGINRALLRGKEPFGMAVMERVTNYRTRVIHLPYGDQASRAFCFTAHKFAEMGGFPDIVMMEDFEVVRRLRKEELAGGGHIHVLDEAALCNPRRWEQPGNNPFVNFWRNWMFLFLYSKLGFSPEQIFRLYYGRDPDPIVVADDSHSLDSGSGGKTLDDHVHVSADPAPSR